VPSGRVPFEGSSAKAVALNINPNPREAILEIESFNIS
jgi:hypothetical protein